MILLYLAILLLCLMGIGLRAQQDGAQALSIQQCNAIKGISILLVFISHANQYVINSGYPYALVGDQLFLTINKEIGQLCVVMFLFYSGFGTEWSILNKGDDYAKRIPKRRGLTTLLNFDVAVVIFLIVNLLLGRAVPFPKFCLSLTGWESIGNSNWYIFDIIVCYMISYISTRVAPTQSRNRFYVILALTLLFIALLYFFKQSWWYDTLLAYPAGAFVALKKDRILGLFKKCYVPVLLITAVLFIGFHAIGFLHAFTYNVTSVLFAFLVLVVTMRIRVNNALLVWLGVNLFPIYIYQRLPMMVMSHYCPSFVASSALLFCIISLAVTVVIAFAYRWIRISIK